MNWKLELWQTIVAGIFGIGLLLRKINQSNGSEGFSFYIGYLLAVLYTWYLAFFIINNVTDYMKKSKVKKSKNKKT